MKSALVFFLLLPFTLVAQESRQRVHQQKADSIVAFFLGEEIFHRYVERTERTRNPVNNAAEQNLYEYTFRHPKFSREKVEIRFLLDSLGQFMPSAKMRGLVRIQTREASWVSAQDALKTCRDQSSQLTKKSLRLTWDASNVSYALFEKSKDFRDVIAGDLLWKVHGKVKFRGDRYSGNFHVNLFTGQVTRYFAIPWD
jgi:hypothetical protein